MNKIGPSPLHRPAFYRVMIDDNFHHADETERITHGDFESADEAIAACRKIVDEMLTETFQLGMTAATLWEVYVAFGDDPFIVALDPKDAPAVSFSAWDYAHERCVALAKEPGDI